MTPLEDSFSCNFNVLIAGIPEGAWACGEHSGGVDRLPNGMRPAPHLLRAWPRRRRSSTCCMGLQKILLDIDKAIRIVRETEEEAEVVPNLMIGFGIDEIQAELCGGDQAAAPQPGVYLKAHPGDRCQLAEGNRRAGGYGELPKADQGNHRQRAGGGGEEIRHSPGAPPFSTTTRWRSIRRSSRRCRIIR